MVQAAPITPPTNKLEHPDDRVGETKTIYQISGWSIFWRNFLAGFARALGGMLLYLIFLGFSAYTFFSYVWPHVAPLVSSYTELLQMMTNPNGTPAPSTPSPQSTQTNFPSLNLNPDQMEALMKNPQIMEMVKNFQSQTQPSN